MKLPVLMQIIDVLHRLFYDDFDDYRNDPPADRGDGSDVEDPVGGSEGITPYDEHNIDPDYNI